jgi:hypothetical protein
MEQSNLGSSKLSAFFKKATMWTSILFFLVLVAIALYIYFFFEIFALIQGGLLSSMGLDGYLAKAVTALIMAIIFYFPSGKLFRSFLPLPQKNKRTYRAIVFLILAAMFFSAHFFAPDVYFDRETGKPLKYYSISPEGGYRFFSSGGFDEITGDSLKPVTKEIITKSREFKKKLKSSDDYPLDPIIGKGDTLDSPADGKGLLGLYRGKVINSRSNTIFFFISARSSSKPINSNFDYGYTLHPGDTIYISLEEGTHFFTVLDADRENLNSSVSFLVHKDNYLGQAKIGQKYYNYSSLYSIKVLAGKWVLLFEEFYINFENQIPDQTDAIRHFNSNFKR